MIQSLTIGTRGSRLALSQAQAVERTLKEKYPQLAVEFKIIKTKGDKLLDAPLAKIGGKGLFTKEIEDQLLAGKIDLAVHSAKDLPVDLPEGLVIGAVLKREDPRDALVSRTGVKLMDLPQGARVATSSVRRKAILNSLGKRFEVTDVRGNVDTRLRKLDAGEFDALVVAVAGLRRMGLAGRITEILDEHLFLPAIGQGAIAVEVRRKNRTVRLLLRSLHDEETAVQVEAERSFLKTLEGGCQVPAGMFSKVNGEGLELDAVLFSPDGKHRIQDRVAGSKGSALRLGRQLAERLMQGEGQAILKQIRG